MALVKCVSCGNDISDKAKACPICGHENAPKTVCEECGAEISAKATACPRCGCPVKKKKNSAGKYAIIITVAALLVLAALIAVGVFSARAEYENNYSKKLSIIADDMLSGAADAESIGNLTLNVWYNSIWKKRDSETDKYTIDGTGTFHDDFNDALNALFSDEDVISKEQALAENQTSVLNQMKALKNAPDSMKEAYDALEKCYDAYFRLTDLALHTSGSYNDFSEKFSDADDDFIECYRKLKFYIE